MNNNLRSRLREIEVENFIFIIFIIIILLSYIANDYEKKYFINNNDDYRYKYYYLQIFIFTIIIIINLYYVLISYMDVRNLSIYDSSKRRKYAYLDLIASLSALVATFIILYIAITDIDIEAEISL